MIPKQEIERIMGIPGKVRGVVFKTDAEFVAAKEGEEGVAKVEKKTEEWGYPIDYETTKNTAWFPVGLRALSVLAAKEVFGWGDEAVYEMGRSAPQYSFMVKFLMRYFLTLKQTYEKSPSYWPTHYTIGTLEAPEFNEKEKYFVLRLKDFNLHEVLCTYYAGYFLRIAEFSANFSNMRIEETKCAGKGDPYHEYVVRWD